MIPLAFMMALTVTPYRAAMAMRVSPLTTTWTSGVATTVDVGAVDGGVADPMAARVAAGVRAEVAGIGVGVAGGGVDGDGLVGVAPAPACRIQSPIAGLAR